MIARLRTKLGDAHMQRGQPNLASGNYKAALRVAPHLTSSWCDLGDAHLEAGRAQDAIPLYLQALKLTPTHWEARAALVDALMATKQYPAAKALLQEPLTEWRQASQVRHQLGKVSLALNETESAIRHFKAESR